MRSSVKLSGLLALLVAGALLVPSLAFAQAAPMANGSDYVTRLIELNYVNPALIALLFGGNVVYDLAPGSTGMGGQGGAIGVMPGYGRGGYGQPTYSQPYNRQPYGPGAGYAQPYAAPGAYVGPPRGVY